MAKPTLLEIATAIAEKYPPAGQDCSVKSRQSVAVRARNLVLCEYVLRGDPAGWSGSASAVPYATVLYEPKGGPEDCEPPPDMMVGLAADWYVEDGNAAVGLVWP